MIVTNSQPVTAETIGGVTYYTTERRGVIYTAHQLAGRWFVSTQRKALGRRHIGGGRYFDTLDDLAAGCAAFAALPVFLSLPASLEA